MKNTLIDAGPLIALFAVDDAYHQHYDELILNWSATGLRLLTTWPCVVEASYLLGQPLRYELLQWVSMGGAVVYPFEPYHLDEMIIWMRRYSEPNKREMDLADASLYWLATETGVLDIMTVDRRDFTRYRLPSGRAFTLH